MIKFPRVIKLLLGSAVLCIFAAAFGCGGEPTQATPAKVDAEPKVLILLDTSAAMDGIFEDGTKIETAITVISELVANLEDSSFDQLALRRYGGPCEGDNTELVFPFDEQDEGAFRNVLGSIAVAGGTTLGSGIEATATDFTGLDRSEGLLRAIIVAGAGDSCQANLSEALGRLSELGIEVTFIGMDIPAVQREELNVAATATGARIVYVQTLRELENVLSTIISELAEGLGGFKVTAPVPQDSEPTATPTIAATGAANIIPTTASPTNTIVPTVPPVSPTVIPTLEPAPVATPTPEDTITVQQEEMDPTPTPTPLPTPTPTPLPTSTPAPTPTLVPTLTPTPLPTPTPTPLPTSTPAPQDAATPHLFFGTVTLADGSLAPDGTVVAAIVGGEEVATTTVESSFQAGLYTLKVGPPPGVSYVGQMVTFTVGGVATGVSVAWQSRGSEKLNLTVP